MLVGSTAAVQCGVPKQKPNRLIVRGHDTDPDDWPWHSTILHRAAKNGQPEYACGGTLLHQNFILTAKHCVQNEGTGYPLSASAIVVRLGVRELYSFHPNLQEHSVLKVHRLKSETLSELNNDIAILELRTSVQFNEHVLPACIVDRPVPTGEFGTVVGFGRTESDQLSLVLKKVEMPVIDTGKCIRTDRAGYGGLLDEGMFCAGYLNGTTVCNGDSGGGFMSTLGGVWYVTGIVSFALAREPGANLCRQNTYSVFTRVLRYSEWIRNVTGLVGKMWGRVCMDSGD